MADQKDPNKLAKELKWLDVKEPDLSRINVWELRVRNVDEELQVPCMRLPTKGLTHVQNTVQIFKTTNLSLPPLIDQSAPALVTTISAKSSSDVNTDQGEALDEILRKVAQTLTRLY